MQKSSFLQLSSFGGKGGIRIDARTGFLLDRGKFEDIEFL